MLSGNPVFIRSSGCPITNFGHDKKRHIYGQTLINQPFTEFIYFEIYNIVKEYFSMGALFSLLNS